MSPDVDLAGYAEARGVLLVGVEDTPWSLTERVRPVLEASPAERVGVEVVVEGRLKQGRNDPDVLNHLLLESDLGPSIVGAGCDLSDEARYTEASDYLSVERLRLDLNLPKVDLKIGRQAITWGSSLVVHPTDPFPEVVALEPGKERQGINAVRAEVPIGVHQASALVALGDDLSPLYAEDTKFEDVPLTGAARFTLRALEADWSVVGWGRPDGLWFAGADLRGTLGVGWWVEGGWHGYEQAPEAVVGIDYSFPWLETVYVAAEYRYDGSGTAPEDYDWAAKGAGISTPTDCAVFDTTGTGTGTGATASASEPEVSRFTLGRHFVHGVLNLRITEDIGLSTATLVNLEDGTGIVVPDLSVNLGTNAVVHLGAQVPYGSDGEFHPDPADLARSLGDLPGPMADALAEVVDGLLFDASVNAWLRYSF